MSRTAPDLKQAIFDARGRTGRHIDALSSKDGKLWAIREFNTHEEAVAVRPSVVHNALTLDEAFELVKGLQ